MDYGASIALTDSEFTEYEDLMKFNNLSLPKLALNCLAGKQSIKLLKCLEFGGTMVTYGGMTRSPMPLPVGPLIFKDIRLRGFWLSHCNNANSIQNRYLIIDQIAKWFENDLIKPSPFIEIPFADWNRGLNLSTFNDTIPTCIKKKVILVLD